MKIRCLTILLLFFFFACNQTKEVPLPLNLIEKEKLKKILIDFHLANAVEQSNKTLKDTTMYKYAKSYYPFIFKNHKISEADFETTLKYYFAEPKKFNEIYEEIIEDLTKLEAEQNKLKDNSKVKNR